MTDRQIKEQVKDIQEVTKTLVASKEKAIAFLASAGIRQGSPVKQPNSRTDADQSK